MTLEEKAKYMEQMVNLNGHPPETVTITRTPIEPSELNLRTAFGRVRRVYVTVEDGTGGFAEARADFRENEWLPQHKTENMRKLFESRILGAVIDLERLFEKGEL